MAAAEVIGVGAQFSTVAGAGFDDYLQVKIPEILLSFWSGL